MKRLWLAKILIALGALAFVVKPFYGYAMMVKHHHPAGNSILVKIFSKRGPDFQDDAGFGISDFDKKSPHPGFKFASISGGLPHHFFNSAYTPGAVNTFSKKERKPRLFRQVPTWLLNSQLII